MTTIYPFSIRIKDKSKQDIHGGDVDDKVLIVDGLNTFISSV